MRVRTGVDGFDPLVGGGLPEGASVILQGPPGNEKDTFGLQFLAEGLRAGEAIVVVLSSSSPESYLASLSNFGVDVEDAIAEGRLKVVDWHAYQEENVSGIEERDHVFRSSIDLTNVGIALSRAIGALPTGIARRGVVELLSPALRLFEVDQVYAFAQSAKAKLARQKVTALFLLEKEMHDPATVSSLSQPFDGVVDIDRRREGDQIVRKIGVLSMKDTVPDERFVLFNLLPGKGIRIRPSEATEAPGTPRPVPPPPEPLPTPAPRPDPIPGEPEDRAPPGNPRAAMILRIAEERVRIDPRDADALFAKASALAAMGDTRTAIETLDRLVEVSDTYPGLWVLRAKLFAKVGDPTGAQASRRKAEEVARREEAKARGGETVPCPLCEGPVPVDAHECPTCGARFLEEVGLAEELESIGKAAVQDKVREEMKVEPETGKPQRPERPTDRISPSRPPVPAEAGRKGMTNGLAREALRGPTGRTNGLTNGVRGRTNGLTNGVRGRTNGLTNGLRGRTNGLTNGLRGRTNGLTNGLRGRTNGLTNGLSAKGRTNGVTNGLATGIAQMRLGMTNGLTNGNGFTNGLGSSRFRREVVMNRWKLYVIPLLCVALLLLPLLSPTGVLTRAYPITIDGNFGDWSSVPLATELPKSGVAGNIDLVRFGVTDNVDYLAFYFEVNGTGLAGGGSPPTMDTFRAFLDIDRDPASGYEVVGLGADRLIEVAGWGGAVNASHLWEWDTNRDSRDWNGWIKAASIPAAVSGARAEAQVDWMSLVAQKAPIDVFFHAQAYDGAFDVSEYSVSTTEGSLRVRATPVVPEIVSGANVQLLRLDFDASVRPVTFDGLVVTLWGTAPPSAASTVHLVDGNGTLLVDRIPVSPQVAFQFSPRTLAPGQSDRLFIVADTSASTGETLGAALLSPQDISAGSAAVRVIRMPAVRGVGYLGAVPAPATVDGGFSEWTTIRTDPTGEGAPASVDLSEYAYYLNGVQASGYFRVAGWALEGSIVPARNAATPQPGTGQADSDRDSVPDSVDPMPNDFNNNGTDDVLESGDYDGDGYDDYPAGPDVYLNTTLPATFPPPFGNRVVSLYIGPSSRPVTRGEDVARVFLDADNDTATGFRVNSIGADYLVEIRGKYGVVTSRSLSEFAGGNPLQWAWTSLSSIPVQADYDRVEFAFDPTSLGIANDSRAYFEVRDWDGRSDTVQGATIRTGTRDIPGNQQWFFRNTSTSGSGCTNNFAADLSAGSSATSTTLSGTQSICWFTPTGEPDTIAGSWEVILDIVVATNATQNFSPNANGDTNAWTTSGCSEASEYQCVDESTGNGDTDYLLSTGNTVTDSLFNIPDWSSPPSPLTIVSVGVEASCRKAVPQAIDVRAIVKSGSTTGVGTTSPSCPDSSSYLTWTETWTTDPADSSAWTVADVNALQIGVRDNDDKTREVRVSHVKAIVTFRPVYSVQIDKCTNPGCSSFVTLYGPTNSNTFGSDVTFTTGSIAAQTLGGNDRIRFRVQIENGGSVTVKYNGAYPGSDDSRGTVAIPEFAEIAIPILAAVLTIPLYRRISRRRRTASRAG